MADEFMDFLAQREPSSLLTVASPEDEISQRLAELQKARTMAALAAGGESAPLNPSQTIGAALLTALPILIGAAVKGKQGAAKGAEAGAIAGPGFIKGIGETRKQEAEKAKLVGQLLGEEAKDVRGVGQKKAELKERDTLARELAEFKGDTAAEKEKRAGIAASGKTGDLTEADKRITDVNDDVRGSLSKGTSMLTLMDNSGIGLDENVGEAILRNVKSRVLPEGAAAELGRGLKEFAISMGKRNFPGNLSQQETEWMIELAGGGLNVPMLGVRRAVLKGMRGLSEVSTGAHKELTDAGIAVRISPLKTPSSLQGEIEALELPTVRAGDVKSLSMFHPGQEILTVFPDGGLARTRRTDTGITLTSVVKGSKEIDRILGRALSGGQ